VADDEELLTVEEAAELVGRSVATVRRWAASGNLPASRAGRQWLIRRADLPTRRRLSRIGPSAQVDLEAAVRHVRSVDIGQLWVPDVLRFEDRFANPEDLQASARARLDGAEAVDPIIEVEIPKTPFFARAAALLSIEDRIAYQAAIAAIAPRIEARLDDSVFSARLNSKRGGRFFLKHDRNQWLRWRNKVTSLAKTTHPWVIETDISAYFVSVQHSLLFSDLEVIAPASIAATLRTMLTTWAPVSGLGIPQGPNASRVLGNFYLVPVDQAMASAPCLYLRFQDDIRLLGTSRAEVLAGQRMLDRECRRRGLALSAQKTRLVHSDDLADASDLDFDAAQYAMDAGGDDEARRVLRGILQKALSGNGTHGRAITFALYRLTLLRDATQLRRVLGHLEDLAPVAPIVARYLRPWLMRPHVQEQLERFFYDADRNTSPYLATWLLAVLGDYQGRSLRSGLLAYVEAVAFDRNQPTWQRAIALNVAATTHDVRTIESLRQIVTAEYDPMLVRAAVTALARIGRLNRSTARASLRVDSKLGLTIHYLRGRTNLPSLVYAERSIDIPVRTGRTEPPRQRRR
jgi:excisionase family DNA binding protein